MTSNIFEINYGESTKNTQVNNLGMREMQEKAYQYRKSKYILIKAPPASGKSRALMFIALDKLKNQKLNKVIVAVPERSIGKSFKSTNLMEYGFFSDWNVKDSNNLTNYGSSTSKVKHLINFLRSSNSEDSILICTHSTLRYAFEQLEPKDFSDLLIAIDEFHHVSQSDNSVLGNTLRKIMANSNAHILAMTGSYFRGDSVPILESEDEQKFQKITYTYYEQLESYKYLKSFAMGYSFYNGKYTDAVSNILDTNKKTIIHIPNINSSESTKEKYDEVDRILESIGTARYDKKTGLWLVTTPLNKELKVADLVTEDNRNKVQEYLRDMSSEDDLDILIALGMAKEGFDWPFAEYALTIGYRNSLTEIVQIIGRITRDSPNKNHAQFTNLIAEPDAQDEDVLFAVNNIMKAITASLLMESVLAPKFKFKPKDSENDDDKRPIDKRPFIEIDDLKKPSTTRSKQIIDNDLNELKATILQDNQIQKAIVSGVKGKVLNKQLIPRIIREVYPDLTEEETEEIRQYVVSDSVMQTKEEIEQGKNDKFIKMANKFINIDELSIDLIDEINPFQKAYEVISKEINAPTLKFIQDYMDGIKTDFSEDELIMLYPQIKQFFNENGKNPSKNSSDQYEQRLAFALSKLFQLKREKENEQFK